VSIITAVYNNVGTIADAMQSVLAQTYPSIEYIVVDGMSTDGTDKVIGNFSDRLAISIREKDSGIYDALNKGLSNATGDIVGFLHSDDMLANPTIIEQVAEKFTDPDVEAVYGDLVYLKTKPRNHILRYWKSGQYNVARFRWGWMPPHPTVYLRRSCYDRFGRFRDDFHIAADYEILLRMMVRNAIRVHYLPTVMVKMRVGGKSNASVRNRLRANAEDKQAWRVNGMTPPLGLRFSKPIRKIPQYLMKPKSID
jgi:glycosyltransferase